MALGDATQTIEHRSYVVELLASATATNGAPTGTAGIGIGDLGSFGTIPSIIRIGVRSTAGSGTMTVTLRLWLRAGGLWFVAKDLNSGLAIAETSANSIAYSEEVSTLFCADRVYLEITEIGGTSTAVTGYAIVGR